MSRLCLRLLLSLITTWLVTQVGLAQQQPSAAGPEQAVAAKASPAGSSTVSAQSQSPEAQNENAVISQPDHRVNVLSPRLTVGAGYSHYSGPAVLPLYLYGWGYGYGGYWGPYALFGWYPPLPPDAYYWGVGPAYPRGEVKLQVEPKTAEVWIDEAYAGTVASLKGSLWLEPGAYNLCVKAPDHADFCRRIYVLSGKKLQVLARLHLVAGEVNP